MIYNGKEYKVIPREGAQIGDLVQVTAIGENDEVCDIYAFITKFDGDGDIHIENVLPDGTNFVNDEDTFKTYKYVKDVEETTRFSVGDTVKIVGMSIEGYGEHIGNNAAFVRIFSGGDVRVSNKIGENNYMDNIYPPSSLELIEKQRQPIAEELSEKVESNPTTLDKATRDKLNEVAKGGSMHIIYKDKEYKEVTDGSGEIGDLIHATEIDRESCDIWCFTTNSIVNLPAVDVRLPLPNGYKVLDIYTDKFKRYRYVKDVKETSTEKSTVFAVVEYSFSHQGLVNKKEVDRHVTLDRAIAVSKGLNNRNRKCFYSVDGILV